MEETTSTHKVTQEVEVLVAVGDKKASREDHRKEARVMRGARIAILCVVMTACGGGQDTDALGDDTTTVTTASMPSAEQLAKAEGVGDIAAGEELFITELDMPANHLACATCHTLDGVDGRSPSLLGISGVAGERVEGLSDIEYLRQSIIDPAAYEEDWPATMPRTYADVLTEEEVNDLVAFLLTQ